MLSWKDFGRVHAFLYRVTGGRLGARMGGIDIALVETTGRRSGQLRTVPIACYPYRDSIVVSASNSGKETHPAWYLNMQANPDVKVQFGRDRYCAVAENVADAERASLWHQIVELNPHQEGYREKALRKIPLVWLRRSQ